MAAKERDESPGKAGRDEAAKLRQALAESWQLVAERERELKILNDFLASVSHSLDQNEIRETILDIVIDNFPKIRFVIMGLFPTGESHVTISCRASGSDVTEKDRLDLSFPITEMTTWDEILSSSEWDEYSQKIPKDSFLNSDILSLVSTDQEEKRQLGFLMLFYAEDQQRTEADWRFLSALAGNASRALQSAQIYQMAVKDSLTELYRRPYFLRRLEREIRRSTLRQLDLTLLMLDIDHFKSINDKYGHAVGDVALKCVAGLIRDLCGDAMVAGRYGGEEFLVLCDGMNEREGRAFAEKIREETEKIEVPVKYEGRPEIIRMTISIGMVVFSHRKEDEAEGLIEMADAALYQAKNSGRNRVAVYERTQAER